MDMEIGETKHKYRIGTKAGFINFLKWDPFVSA